MLNATLIKRKIHEVRLREREALPHGKTLVAVDVDRVGLDAEVVVQASAHLGEAMKGVLRIRELVAKGLHALAQLLHFAHHPATVG